MGKVIGFAGNKQAGKNTTANVLHGIVLKKRGMVKDYTLGNNGELLIKVISGKDEWSVFDVTRKDNDFIEYAESQMWPYIKIYSFADSLKWIGKELFNIPYKCLYGTDEQKNQQIDHLLWENMPGVTTHKTSQKLVDNVVAGRLGVYYEKVLSGVVYHKPGPMTAREFMQFFGTEVMRKMWEPVWVNNTIKRIQEEDSELAIVADVRFPNEVTSLQDIGGKVYWLNRKMYNDTHGSENVLNPENYDHNNFSGVIENQGEGHTIESLKEKIELLYEGKL